MSDLDWKAQHGVDSEKALDHELVVAVMAELRENLGVSDTGLPAYGIRKVAYYAASVARAQALGFDPNLLRITDSEANVREYSELPFRVVGVYDLPQEADHA